MQRDIHFPTVPQVLYVRRLVLSGLFSIPMIVRLSGVPLRDVFRIEKSLRKNTDHQSFR